MDASTNVTPLENMTFGHIASTNSAMTSQEVDRLLWVYWSPFTFITGMFGNILVIKIFCFTNHKKITTATTSVYFIVMAIADASFLLFGILPEWLSACQFIVLQTLHPVMCKLEKFLFYTSGDVAIWIICVNTMDRFIAVCFPFTQQKIRRVAYAKMVALITVILAAGKNLHVFWTRGLEVTGDVCGRPKQYEYFELYVRPWIAFVLVALLPCLVLTVFNIFIMRFLLRERRRKKQKGRKHHPDFLQTIIMCVSVSVAFVILVTPSLIIYIGKPYWSSCGGQGHNYSYKIAKAVSNQLSYVNHSINFLLYCITAKKFRDEVFHLISPLNSLRDMINQKETFLDPENATIINKGEIMDSPTARRRSLRLSWKRKSSSKSLNQTKVMGSNKTEITVKQNQPNGHSALNGKTQADIVVNCNGDTLHGQVELEEGDNLLDNDAGKKQCVADINVNCNKTDVRQKHMNLCGKEALPEVGSCSTGVDQKMGGNDVDCNSYSSLKLEQTKDETFERGIEWKQASSIDDKRIIIGFYWWWNVTSERNIEYAFTKFYNELWWYHISYLMNIKLWY